MNNTWNYRVLRHSDGSLGIYEVYYTDGNPDSRSSVPCAVGDNLDELTRELRNMQRALSEDILDITTYKKV